MKTRVEQLPVELWISLFSYLEFHDLFQAFTNLNNYFDKLLLSDHLSFYLQLKKNSINNTTDLYSSDSVLNRITYLRLSTTTHFIELNVHKLARLKSLIIEIQIVESHIISQIIQDLHSLEYLSIICHMTPSLCEAIFSKSTLSVCQLDVRKVTDLMNFTANNTSNIETLYIIYSNVLDCSFISVFLSHTPKLKRLKISTDFWSTFDGEVMFTHSLPIFHELRSIELQLISVCNCLTSTFLECLHSKMPNLKYFHLNIDYKYLNEFLSKNLYNDWWTILKKIPKFKILFQGYKRIYNGTKINVRKELDNEQQTLFDTMNQNDKRYKTEWIDKNFETFLIIKISISNL